MQDDATPTEILAAQLKLLDLDALIRGILHSATIFLADISSGVLTDIRDQPGVRLVEPDRLLTIDDLDTAAGLEGWAASAVCGDSTVPPAP